jgi:hypothetical protein
MKYDSPIVNINPLIYAEVVKIFLYNNLILDEEIKIINKTLSPEILDYSFLGNKLGQFKLEYKIKEAVFLAPKVYALRLDDGTEIVKNKGYKEKDLSWVKVIL